MSLLARFVRFGIVGGSGVVVNLGIYALMTRGFGLGDDLLGRYVSYAFSVEISILTNFFLNDIWTFSDRRGENPWLIRMFRFHVVSLVGAAMNWGIFAVLNWLIESGRFSFFGDFSVFGYSGNLDDMVAACIGIIGAMMWNFFANLWWTWKEGASDA